jgi:hypothetical protein
MLFEVGEKILPIMQASFSTHIKGCVPCRVPLAKTCQDLPRLPKTCLVSIPSVGIYRHLSAAVIQDLGGNVLYLARLSAWCNGS